MKGGYTIMSIDIKKVLGNMNNSANKLDNLDKNGYK